MVCDAEVDDAIADVVVAEVITMCECHARRTSLNIDLR